MATFTVTTTSDSGAGSLRQAILDANSSASSPILIVFNISAGSFPKIIQPVTALPALTASFVCVDGSSQPGFSGTPVIQLDGSLLTSYTIDGLVLQGASNCVIQYLIFNNGFRAGVSILADNTAMKGANNNTVWECYSGTDSTGFSAAANTYGILIQGTSSFACSRNGIGCSNSGKGNLLSGNVDAGLCLMTNVNNTSVSGNTIGLVLDESGALANGAGIMIIGSLNSSDTNMSDSNYIHDNVISGNTGAGVSIAANCTNSIVEENAIGVASDFVTPFGNGTGVYLSGRTDVNGSIPGTQIDLTNTISNNSGDGVFLGTNVSSTLVGDNMIQNNGGHGVHILGVLNGPASSNAVQSSTISGNGQNGILVDGSSSTPSILNSFIVNSIFDNGASGVALANGSNNSQSTPTIQSATWNSDYSILWVQATAPSSPSSSTFRIEFYVNNANNNPKTEGELYLGSLTASTSQNFTFGLSNRFASTAGFLSMTATNLNNVSGSLGDSSVFTSNTSIGLFSQAIPSIMQSPCQ